MITKREFLELVIAEFESIYTLKIRPKYNAGICQLSCEMVDDLDVDFDALGLLKGIRTKAFKSWPLFSGHIAFPIPDPSDLSLDLKWKSKGYLREENARVIFNNEEKWEGPYGILRYCLLGHLIRELKKELENE